MTRADSSETRDAGLEGNRSLLALAGAQEGPSGTQWWEEAGRRKLCLEAQKIPETATALIRFQYQKAQGHRVTPSFFKLFSA